MFYGAAYIFNNVGSVAAKVENVAAKVENVKVEPAAVDAAVSPSSLPMMANPVGVTANGADHDTPTGEAEGDADAPQAETGTIVPWEWPPPVQREWWNEEGLVDQLMLMPPSPMESMSKVVTEGLEDQLMVDPPSPKESTITTSKVSEAS